MSKATVTDLTKVDPAWAWSPYEPDAALPWSRRLAAHLYRRAGFAANTLELDEAVKAGAPAAIDRLCNPKPTEHQAAFERTSAMLADRSAATGNTPQLAAWWLYRMLNTPDPLLEKLTLFWHGHFATSAAKVLKPRLMLDQNRLLRQHARGEFADMVKAISRDPAMLLYLDSATNRRIRPNENYGRELMELFCLGVGNYTEADIKELARAFTGWEVRADRFGINKTQHDTGTKTFLGHSGNFDGDDAIRVVLEQPAAPRFIARKLVRYFVFDEPDAPDALIDPVAQDLRRQDFQIGPVVQRILGSNLFFSEHALGGKVRAPVELAAGLLRALGATTNLIKLAQGTGELGQSLFFPPNVKGWDGGRAWINSSTLLGRANLVRQVLTAGETKFDTAGGGSLASLAERAGATTPEKTVDWLLELLVAVTVPAAARGALVQLAGDNDGPGDRSKRIAELIHAVAALPEFQLA
jgi:uncharacterized protein (DUF1800 family)